MSVGTEGLVILRVPAAVLLPSFALKGLPSALGIVENVQEHFPLYQGSGRLNHFLPFDLWEDGFISTTISSRKFLRTFERCVEEPGLSL